jgi:hypothetical protein
MTQEDIIRMAREADPKANLSEPYCLDYETKAWLERFADLVRADEREACAKHCEGINSLEDYYGDRPELACAESIRARGKA